MYFELRAIRAKILTPTRSNFITIIDSDLLKNDILNQKTKKKEKRNIKK